MELIVRNCIHEKEAVVPIRVEWGNPEKTILKEIIEGEWTLADIYGMLDAADKLISQVPHRVDIIADMSSARFSKSNLLSTLGRIERRRPTNTGMIVAVKANTYLKAMAELARKVAPTALVNVQFADTLEQAQEILQSRAAR